MPLSHHIRTWYDNFQLDQLVARIQDLQQSGVGVEEIWAEPGTPATEILNWYAEMFSQAPRIGLTTLDRVKVVIKYCSQQQKEAIESGEQSDLGDAEEVIVWEGSRRDWWWEGHETVAAALPAEHNGLYLGMQSMSTLIAAMQKQ